MEDKKKVVNMIKLGKALDQDTQKLEKKLLDLSQRENEEEKFCWKDKIKKQKGKEE